MPDVFNNMDGPNIIRRDTIEQEVQECHSDIQIESVKLEERKLHKKKCPNIEYCKNSQHRTSKTDDPNILKFETSKRSRINIRQKEHCLEIKEKELLEKEKQIKRRLIQLKKREEKTIQKKLQAAAKLESAKKQLHLILAADKLTGGNSKKHKKKKKHSHEERSVLKKIRNVCECDPKRSKRGGQNPKSFFRRLFGWACKCKPNASGNQNNRSFGPQLFGLNPRWCPENRPEPKRNIWTDAVAAGDCYLMSLRHPPRPRIYHRWPKFHPHCLGFHQQWKNLDNVLMLVAGTLSMLALLIPLQMLLLAILF